MWALLPTKSSNGGLWRMEKKIVEKRISTNVIDWMHSDFPHWTHWISHERMSHACNNISITWETNGIHPEQKSITVVHERARNQSIRNELIYTNGHKMYEAFVRALTCTRESRFRFQLFPYTRKKSWIFRQFLASWKLDFPNDAQKIYSSANEFH